MVGDLDTRPVTAETELVFPDALIDGGNMPSAATPCGLPTGRAFHLVTHLPPAPSLVLFLLQFFLKVFCFTDMIGGGILSYII